MPRYGDLDALFNERPEYLNPQHETNGEYNRGWNACNEHYSELIRNAPTADVEEVVYCEDCKYCEIGENEVDAWCDCSLFNIGGVADFYCKAGERRNDG